MRINLPSIVPFIILALLGSPVALAQTPDGLTPAEESVCDVLKEDGVTKGLYGLCVAFCEAQDLASLSSPVTEDELIALEERAPSANILEAYNKKKDKAQNPNDVPMPCIEVQEPCPCATAEEVAAIDGFSDYTATPMPIFAKYGDFQTWGALHEEKFTTSVSGEDGHRWTIFLSRLYPDGNGSCGYERMVYAHPIIPHDAGWVYRHFSTYLNPDSDMYMSPAQAQACFDLLRQYEPLVP